MSCALLYFVLALANADKPDPPTDLYGDPLPPGAITRLGTVRFRHGGSQKRLYFLSERQKLLSVSPAPDSRVRLWEAKTGRLLHELNPADRSLSACQPSADGKLLATLASKFDRDRREYRYQLELWDTQNWKPRTLATWADAPGRRATCLALAPSGATIAAGGSRGKVRLFDVASGEEILSYSVTKREINSMAFSPDSRLLAMAADDGVILWDWLSGEEPKKLNEAPRNAHRVIFSPNGKLLAAANGDGFAARLWDVASQRFIAKLKGPAGRYGAGLAFSPDGKMLAASAPLANGVEVFDVASGKVIRSLDAKIKTGEVAMSADGRLLATAGYAAAAIKVFDLRTGKEALTLVGHGKTGSSHGFALSFSPDGHRLFSFGNRDGLLRVFNARSGEAIAAHQTVTDKAEKPGRLVFPPPVVGASFTVDATTLLVAVENHLEFYDVKSGRLLEKYRFDDRLGRFSVSPDGKRLATLEGRRVKAEANSGQNATRRRIWLRLRDLHSKKVLREIEVSSTSWQIEFSPSGKLLAASQSKPTPKGRSRWTSVWETETGNEYARVTGYKGQPIALAFSPDGKRLASSYFDTPAVLIWDLDDFRVGQ